VYLTSYLRQYNAAITYNDTILVYALMILVSGRGCMNMFRKAVLF